MSYSPAFRGSNALGSARSAETGYQNGTGFTLTKSTPVSTNTSGQLVKVDVSSETLTQALVGLCSSDIPSAANGMVSNAGRLENISTSFSVGDPIWLGKTAGTLTNVKPDVGVGGFVTSDWVIFVGVITKNEFNGSLKDIQLMIQIVGQL